jgi:hypothetical protein
VQDDLGEKLINERGKGSTNARRKQHQCEHQHEQQHQHEKNDAKIAKRK